VEGKVCVVTGANTGIGLETARALARLGATVVMTARSRPRGEAALADVRASAPGAKVELLELDLASLAKVRAAAAELLARHARIHVLVNNAGLVLSERRETEDGFESTFGVNHLGPFLFTSLLLERLKASAPARVVNVSSRAHTRARGLDFDDLDRRRRSYSSLAAYADSKLANILFTIELARRLEGTGVTANSLHPGVVATGFGADGDTRGVFRYLLAMGRPFLMSPVKGAATSIYLASSPEVEGVSGRYFARCREARTTAAARDAAAARRLWEESERLTGSRAGAPAARE
jgi:NAD(P)-dependent dehydrogenase (short-subunit alcohol dehydrogenase family)